jgi:hypothetical protein
MTRKTQCNGEIILQNLPFLLCIHHWSCYYFIGGNESSLLNRHFQYSVELHSNIQRHPYFAYVIVYHEFGFDFPFNTHYNLYGAMLSVIINGRNDFVS